MWTGGDTGKCGGRLLENVDGVWKNVDRVADKRNILCVGGLENLPFCPLLRIKNGIGHTFLLQSLTTFFSVRYLMGPYAY